MITHKTAELFTFLNLPTQRGRTIAGNVSGNFIWQFHEKWSKIDTGSFWFGDYRVNMIIIQKSCPTHQSKPRVRLTNHGDVWYRRHRHLHERTPRLQALLDHDHWRNVRLQREPENTKDAYAVAVMANSIVVGHVLRKISTACSLFLCWNGSTVHCTITGHSNQAWYT